MVRRGHRVRGQDIDEWTLRVDNLDELVRRFLFQEGYYFGRTEKGVPVPSFQGEYALFVVGVSLAGGA